MVVAILDNPQFSAIVVTYTKMYFLLWNRQELTNRHKKQKPYAGSLENKDYEIKRLKTVGSHIKKKEQNKHINKQINKQDWVKNNDPDFQSKKVLIS